MEQGSINTPFHDPLQDQQHTVKDALLVVLSKAGSLPDVYKSSCKKETDFMRANSHIRRQKIIPKYVSLISWWLGGEFMEREKLLAD
jgi:hypothetical protein